MYCLQYTQCLPISLEAAWNFFSSPHNLAKLTPQELRLEMIVKDVEEEIYPGKLIAYTIRPLLHIPLTWITEITHVKKGEYFIDEQRFGPYKFWHHEHRFHAITNGVKVHDIIHLKMPFGVVGKALYAFKVKNDLAKIFAYRRKQLEQLFGRHV